MSLLRLLTCTRAAPPPPPPTPTQSGGMPGAIRPWALTPLAVLDVTPANAQDVFAQGVALQQAATNRPERERLVEYRLAPGVYPHPALNARWSYLRGVTGNPDDVVFTSDQDGDVLHTWGGPIWFEALTLRALPPGPGQQWGPKYPLHGAGSGTQTFLRVVFDSTTTASDGGGAVIGLDGAPNLTLTLWGCGFRNAGGWLTNMHGPGGDLTIAVVDCWQDTPTAGAGVAYSGHSTDRVWHVGGGAHVSVEAPVTLLTEKWPAPVGGLSAWDRSRYGVT